MRCHRGRICRVCNGSVYGRSQSSDLELCVVFHRYSPHSSRSQTQPGRRVLPHLHMTLCCVPIRSSRDLIAVSTLVLEEELLSGEIASKCDRRNTEAGERAAQAVEAGEGAGVSPLLAVACQSRAVEGFQACECGGKRTIVPMGRPLCRFLQPRRASSGRSR